MDDLKSELLGEAEAKCIFLLVQAVLAWFLWGFTLSNGMTYYIVFL